MSQNDDLLIYDDDDAVKFILSHLPPSMQEKFGQDDIDYVLDVVYEFYDSKGYLEEDSEEEVMVDEEEIYHFVLKTAQEDEMDQYTAEDIKAILDGEFEYCKSIGIFNDEDEE